MVTLFTVFRFHYSFVRVIESGFTLTILFAQCEVFYINQIMFLSFLCRKDIESETLQLEMGLKNQPTWVKTRFLPKDQIGLSWAKIVNTEFGRIPYLLQISM